MATLKIRSANNASMSTLAPHLPRIESRTNPESNYIISLVGASGLSQDIKDRIFTLFDKNMSTLASSSSLSYTESSKREELFDETGRFILLSKTDVGSTIDLERELELGLETDGVDMPGRLPMPTPRSRVGGGLVKSNGKGKGREVSPDAGASNGGLGSAHDSESVVGYVSFRFDTEETLGPKDAEVIYCYELQLDESIRKLGFGKILMDEMERIGRTRRMDKAMLTCYKNNIPALSFYRKQGYEPDEIDPTRLDEEEEEGDGEDSEDEGWEQVGQDGESDNEEGVDYVILSKSLR